MVAALAVGLVGCGSAAGASLPSVASGHRPGPDALYAPPFDAPQLQNVAPFTAPPILVSGAHAYRDGEFLYQDFLHDDRGAQGTPDPTDPMSPLRLSFKGRAGTLTYPTAARFANNAADLVELRVRPVPGGTAFRVTLNTLLDPAVPAVTVALGDGDGSVRAWPHGAGVASPASLFLTVHGGVAELLDAPTGRPLAPAPVATVDVPRRQLTVTVAAAAWDPGRDVVRMAAGVGLWDGSGYAQPGSSATATAPGGAAASGAALFNLAFRDGEAAPTGPAPGVTIVDTSVLSSVNAAWWRDLGQAGALAAGDASRFRQPVDFGKLRDRIDDDSAVPRTGAITRIFAGHDEFAQGIDVGRLCAREPVHCDGALSGRLQAYTVYVPVDRPAPAGGYGMTLLLHALVENQNQYIGSNYQRQLGERGAGYLVVTPSGRGPDGDYTDAGEANVFETWADVARWYRLDPTRVTLSGFSMGGGGTYRLLSRWPDLFARGAAVGAAALEDQVGSLLGLRNTPLLSWVASGDEGTNPVLQEQAIARQTELGLDWTFDQFPTGDHLTIPTSDEFGPFADFLGDAVVDRSPPHVSFGVVPAHDFARVGVVADHAYWLSGLRVADGAALGTIDARSEGFGLGDPPVLPVRSGAGVVTGRYPLAYLERRQGRGPAPRTPVRDRLVVTTTNLTSAVVDARRARLSCTPQLELHTDRPLNLTIDCATPVRACARSVTLRLPHVEGRRFTRVTATRKGRTLKVRIGRDLRSITLKRPTGHALSIRLTARTHSGLKVTTTRRLPACGV